MIDQAKSTLTVFCTMGVRRAMESLVPQYEKATGHKLAIEYNTSVSLRKRIEAGECADILISTADSLEHLITLGKVIAGSVFPLAHSGVAVAVRRGAEKPDISTPEALKRTLLNARAVAYSDPSGGGASGVHFANVLQRLGIADAMNPKAKLAPVGTFSAQLLVDNEVDLAIQQGPELLSVEGVELVGPLPGDLQNITVFSAGVLKGADEAAARAKALIEFLRLPEAKAVMAAKGLTAS